jgi:hypothetical protein
MDGLGLKDTTVKPVPVKVTLALHAFKDEPPFDLNCNYRLPFGKLHYLAQTTRSNIVYTMHQISKYSSDPRQSYGKDTLYLVCYLNKGAHLGLKFKPDSKKGFECYGEADFSGNWTKEFAPVNLSTAESQNGWIISYSGCPDVSCLERYHTNVLLACLTKVRC